MSSPVDEVRRVAALAQIEIDDEQAATFVAQIGEILDYVAMIDAAALDGVVPTSTIFEEGRPLREDRIEPSLDSDRALGNAPERSADQFVVPRVRGG